MLHIFIYIFILVASFVILGYKMNNDLHPYFFKLFMTKMAIKNWQKKFQPLIQIKRLGEIKSTKDIGIFPSAEERRLESPAQIISEEGHDELMFFGTDDKSSNSIMLKISRFYNSVTHSHIFIHFDGQTYFENFEGVSTNDKEFSLGTLKFELLEAFRSWRLLYNGPLRIERKHDGKETGEDQVHCAINVLWKGVELPWHMRKESNIDLVGEWLCRNGIFGDMLPNLGNVLPNGYRQFGSYHGTIKLNGKEHDPFYLHGFRIRKEVMAQHQEDMNVSNPSDQGNNHLELFGMCSTYGNAFHLAGFNGNWIDGNALYASNWSRPFTKIGMSAKPFCATNFESFPKHFNMFDEKSSTHVEIWPRFDYLCFATLTVILFPITLNGRKGRGILIKNLDHLLTKKQNEIKGISEAKNNRLCRHHYIPRPLKTPKLLHGATHLEEIYNNQDRKELFIDFETLKAPPLSLVGGKARSLIKMNQMKQVLRNRVQMETARGFCATTALFSRYIKLDKLEALFCQDGLSIEEKCDRAQAIVRSNCDEESLSQLVEPWIQKIFKLDELHTSIGAYKFAVRSSGVLEDGDDLSCAGQNETFLGVSQKHVSSKIISCWLSLFSSRSVQYRLNNGQSAVTTMGVVVQEMVHAQTAGVVFTADPVTANPFEIIITANYGLGESVVSASSDPDTFVVRRPYIFRESEEDDFQIKSKSLGEKSTKIVMNRNSGETESSETHEVPVEESYSQRFCIDDNTCLKLASLAHRLEFCLGQLKPVDIEWAINKNSVIYLLQCRHVTSLDNWSDFEILHELDSGLRSKSDLLTIGNIGEVIPNLLSPLSMKVTCGLIDITLQNRLSDAFEFRFNPTHASLCQVYNFKPFMLISNSMYNMMPKEPTVPAFISAMELSIFGHKVFNEDLYNFFLERNGTSTPMLKLQNILYTVNNHFIRSSRDVKKVGKEYENFQIPFKDVEDDIQNLYSRIDENIYKLLKIVELHCRMSELSMQTQMFMIMALSSKVDDWDEALYEDASKVSVVHTDVESANVPLAIEKLADLISKSQRDKSHFLNADPKDAIKWLHEDSRMSKSLDDFLKVHGHRCISEFDLASKSWSMEPSSLIVLLQNAVRGKMAQLDMNVDQKAKVKENCSDDDLINSLKTKITGGGRRVIKFFLPYHRRAVLHREKTKSLGVRTVHLFKQLYNHLAGLIVKKGILPNENLIFYLTHAELGRIIHEDLNRSKLLKRALRRQKLYNQKKDDEYKELYTGFPHPVSEGNVIFSTESDQVTVRGTPVCVGKVKGTAKVCLNVQEAAMMIKPGDILITKGTDIAWSPFFPILGGVVTELGGLISHGAVVAREYGLPCLVGAISATKVFRTGDEVILDASAGAISKI